MTKHRLIEMLREIGERSGDREENHWEADRLLIDYIDDEEVSEAFWSIEKWYA